jgi:hypothetical protein
MTARLRLSASSGFRRLDINLSSMQEDPHSGLQRFDVSEISVGEPDGKWFEAPAGYKVLDVREPRKLPADSSSRQYLLNG